MVVPEPSVDETFEIMLGLRERYEAHHKLRYTDESLMAAAKYASHYISDRFLPDKVRAAGAGVAALRWWRRCWADTECGQWAGFTCVLKWGMHLLPLPAGTHIPPAETAPLLPPPPASPASPLCRPST